MDRMVALLRGVNVGGHRKVPMADLSALAGDMGFRDAATWIQSGNLVFGTSLAPAAAAARLARGIEERFGFPVDLVLRTGAQWRRLAAGNPLPEASAAAPDRVMLLLSREPPLPGAAAALRERARDGERIEAAAGALWIHHPAGAGKSRLTPALVDSLVGSPTTARNWTTVRALGDMLEGRSPVRRGPREASSPPSPPTRPTPSRGRRG